MANLFDRLKADAHEAWAAYTRHAFVSAMGDGSLPQACFRHYLVQDYLFLIQFARAYALGVTKANSLADMRSCSGAMSAILDVEMNLHVALCGEWGISPEELEQAPEARATMAYTRFVLEAGHRGDLLDLMCALSPCVIGYAEIGAALAAESKSRRADANCGSLGARAGEAGSTRHRPCQIGLQRSQYVAALRARASLFCAHQQPQIPRCGRRLFCAVVELYRFC